MKFAAAVILATLMLFTFSAQAQYARADPYETAVTQIQKAMSPNSNGVQHFRWVSLRLLADPAMNPLFETLVAKKDIALRIDGFMGIALVSADKTLDATRVIQLKDPALRTLLITEALGLELLKPAALNEFLQAPDLTNYERTLLVAELNRQGQPWDPSLLINAPTDDGAEVAGLACMLMLERGDQSAWKNLLVKYNTLPPADQTDLVRQLANAARQYRITAAAAPLLEITKESTGADRIAAITTAMALSPKVVGRAALLERIKSDRSQKNLAQMGLLMLSSQEGFQADDFAQLRNGDPLLEAMATAGVAMRTANADPLVALLGLLENGNRYTTEYVLSITPTLPPALAKQLLLTLLKRLTQAKGIRNEDQISALLAVQQLLRMPQAHEELLNLTLQNINNNLELLETIMSVVGDSSNQEAAQFARMIRTKLPRHGDSLALLALAKASTPLTAAEVQELGSIASGGGNVDDSSQIQAAWLYLKYCKRENDAISQLTR